MNNKNVFVMIGGILIVFIIGIIFIVLTSFKSTDNATSKDMKSLIFSSNQMTDGERTDFISSFDSEIVDSEIDFNNVEVEAESLDTSQIYFENILSLYDYFSLKDVEYFKQDASKFIHENVDPSILDCTLVTNTIKETDSVISFELSANDEIVSVEMFKDTHGYLNTKFKRLIANRN